MYDIYVMGFYLFLGNVQLFVQHFIPGRQLSVLLQETLADTGRQLQVTLFLKGQN